MRTYRAELAPWRMYPIHPAYKERAAEDALRRAVRAAHAYETTCPYCGRPDGLSGIVRVGSKDHVAGIPMGSEGYAHHLPGTGGKGTELVIVYCAYDHRNPATGECGPAAIDPVAYLSPAVFYAIRQDSDLD
jgi:hypothetical protein